MASSTIPQSVSINARPYLLGPEYAAAAEALAAGQYGHGPLTERFEADVARFLGVPDVVAVSSGTAALQIALMLAEIGPGDEVVVPSQTFCASVQAIVAAGAAPRFAEINPDTMCVDAHTVLEALTPATRAVMPVLYSGRAVDLSDIQDLLDERGIVVIEDAAQAFGSYLGDKRVGSARSAVVCFSFGPIKQLTCIEGGAIVPRDSSEAATARRLRTLGIIQSQAERIRSTSYLVEGHGLRATMSSVHAAVGSVQLERFDVIEARRKSLWRAYAAALTDAGGVALVDVDVDRSVPFNCVVRIPRRDTIHRILRDQGIGVGVHYPPNHLQPAFVRWFRSLPVTEATGREILSLPFHPGMDADDVPVVVDVLRHALEGR
jgi:dTDP-4-amino-4,6-dideoxygalactose transaminase